MTSTATLGKPLSPAEQVKLIELLTRAGGVSMVASKMAARQKVGSRWQAMVNLSVPRPDGQTDLVTRGNTVTLTDEEAEQFLPPAKPFPMIRPADQQHLQLPFQHPKQHWGATRGVPGTWSASGPMDQTEARPDPPGSTVVEVRNVAEGPPEGREPRPGDETISALAAELGLQTPPVADAQDIPPRSRA